MASITVLRDKVILEIYNNYPRDIDVKRKFDLSWPENEELEASRSSERYCLKLIHIQNPNQFQFFKSLLIEISSDEQDKVLLLSINEKLYWLTPRTEYDDFSIETIKVCSANILEFHFLPELSTLLILEDNNCLSTIYRCPYTNLVKQKAIFLEGTVISYEFLVSQKLFVYSNGFKVFQIQFVIDEILDQIQHVVREVKLSGIVALSCRYLGNLTRHLKCNLRIFLDINYLNIFIGISENGLFYKIPIVKHQTQSYAREYFLEVSNQQESINDISKRVFRENERQMETEKKLEDKMIDFRTLATLQKNDRKLGVTATVCYHKNMPDLEEFAVVAKKSCCWLDNNIFVEIWLEVKEDLREDLKNTLKNCMLTVGSGAYTLTSNVKEFNKLQVVLIEKLNEEYPILPNIDLCLNSVFTMRNCSFLVQQNIEICLENLELLAACSGSIQRNISRSQTKIAQVIANLSGAQKVPTKVLVQSTIKVPKSKLKVFLDELGFRDTFYINFCKSSVEVKISDNSIHTQSENAAALLFAKKYLLFKMMPLSIKNLNTDLREGLEVCLNLP